MKCLVLSWRLESCLFSYRIIYFVYKPLELCISIYFCLSAAPLCYECFDCRGTSPDLIDLVPRPALFHLCVGLILTCGKSSRFSKTNTRNKHKWEQTRNLFW